MKKQFNEQLIVSYLLGALPPAEAEQLDELGLVDDECAAAIEVVENDLVDAYVRGELDGATLEQFNSHYLASPRRRERVAFARSLRVWGEREAGLPGSSGSAPKYHFFRRFARPSLRLISPSALPWGLAAAAAALILLAAGGWLLFENARLRRQMSETEARRVDLRQHEEELRRELAAERTEGAAAAQELARVRAERERLEQQLKEEEARQTRPSEERARPAARPPAGEARIVAFVLAPQLRGAGQLASISIPPQSDQVIMRLELEPHEYLAYRVRLLDPSRHQTLWQSGKLRARKTGDGQTLNVSLRTSLLKPQIYVLQVFGVAARGATENVSDYTFKVVK